MSGTPNLHQLLQQLGQHPKAVRFNWYDGRASVSSTHVVNDLPCTTHLHINPDAETSRWLVLGAAIATLSEQGFYHEWPPLYTSNSKSWTCFVLRDCKTPSELTPTVAEHPDRLCALLMALLKALET